MTFDEAVHLILSESEDKNGLIVKLRDNEPPTEQKVQLLLLALRTVFDELRGKRLLDRTLASGLFAIAFYSHAYAEHVRFKSGDGARFFELLQFDIQFAVESIFLDIWTCAQD